MTEKTKIVKVGEQAYQLRRFAPDVGSFLLMQILGASLKGGNFSETPPAGSTGAPQTPTVEPSGEDVVKAIVFAALLRGMDFEMHRFVQSKCLAVCARMEGPDGETAMPLVGSAGILPPERDDMQLIIKLEVEVLVFNFADFFAGGGLNALAGKQPPASKG